MRGGHKRQRVAAALTPRTLQALEALQGTTRRERPLLFQRLALALLQVGVGAGLSAGAYALLRGSEEAAFRAQFQDVATHVVEATTLHMAQHVASAATLALFVSQSVNSSAYPNVTVPGFDALGDTALDLFSARLFSFVPVVTQATRGAWEAYAAGVLGAAAPATGIFSFNATGGRVRSPDGTPLLPLWQISPSAPGNQGALLLNVANVPIEMAASQAAAATGQPAASDTLVIVQDRDLPVPRPSSIVYAPVMRAGAAVAFACVVFSWDTTLINSLPNFVNGIDAVLVSGVSGSVYSFRLDGDEVSNTGAFDTHETDSTLVSLSKQVVLSAGPSQNWTLYLYPTAQLRARHLTSTPGVACAVVVVIVTISSALFWCYDWWASGRTMRLESAFMLTRQVVEDVYPEGVRSRVLQRALVELKRNAALPSSSSMTMELVGAETGMVETTQPPVMLPAWVRRWRACVHKRTNARASVSVRGMRDEPIADTFEECTVLFADLCEFTTWSATVAPARVFVVLEAIFNSFDKLAAELGIFKLETVGDCYVCCAGCPVPKADHAERIAAFALLMVPAMKRAAASVGVTGMQMRIGIHSGPITAGVLRTEKGRFQMFGDSMNTASRMESSGQPGRVQVSEVTAALLRDVPGLVLEPRGAVAIKGKGDMQTFWLVAAPGQSSEDTAGRA